MVLTFEADEGTLEPMNTLFDLRATQPITHAVLVLCLVSVAGLVIGKAKYRGIGLGTAGTLFAGILFGHFNRQPIAKEVLEFAKDFGLILFVFAIGLRLGPGFVASLRRQGLRLNALAASIIVAGALIAASLGLAVRIAPTAIAGLFCGATTNTPALGAVEQTLRLKRAASDAPDELPALAYAVAYPVGVTGLIGSLLLLRWWFRIDPEAESKAMADEQEQATPRLERRTLRIDNRNLEGIPIGDIPGLVELGISISRIRSSGEERSRVVRSDAVTRVGDLILAVGTPHNLDRFQRIVGERAEEDLFTAPGAVTYRRVIVTKREILGKSLGDLALNVRLGVTVTRLLRAEVEVPATPSLRLQFGDVLHLVGASHDIDQAERELGNSAKALNETQFLALFAGIAAGLILGLVPISIPGLPHPVRLGLAGGPLIVALLVSRAGHLGPLVWYMPPSANLAFRELGITLFLACVGLQAGGKFFDTVLTPNGAIWVVAAACITMIPLLILGGLARWRWRMNYATLAGVLAGSLTDPPALAFANSVCKSDSPSLGYATVYPAAMLLRITVAQILTLALV